MDADPHSSRRMVRAGYSTITAMRIALGADHAGVALKEHVKRLLDDLHVAYEDFGTATDTSVDYPDFAAHVAREVASGGFDRGILVCGSGLGMAIAANKIRGIRAVPVSDVDSARLAREHNDANVLALGGRFTSVEQAKEVVRIFLETPFAGGRHQRRIDKIAELELRVGTSTSSEPASKAAVANKKI